MVFIGHLFVARIIVFLTTGIETDVIKCHVDVSQKPALNAPSAAPSARFSVDVSVPRRAFSSTRNETTTRSIISSPMLFTVNVAAFVSAFATRRDFRN